MPIISESEKQLRRQQNASVTASLAIEGLELDEVTRDLGRRFDEGELTPEQFSEAVLKHAQTLAERKAAAVA